MERDNTIKCLKVTVVEGAASSARLKPCTMDSVAVTPLSVHQGKKEVYAINQLVAGRCHCTSANNSQTPDMCTQLSIFCSFTLLFPDFHAVCYA